jgi:polyphenol oxidase
LGPRPFGLDDGRRAVVRFSTSAAGNLDARLDDRSGLEARRHALVDGPWVALRQVHGARVRTVRRLDEAPAVAGSEGDGLVTDLSGVVLSVNSADCAPVALVGRGGVVAAVHAGWRGLVAGVIEQAVTAMRSLRSGAIDAWLGPCIHPECYEFSPADLAAVAERYGVGVGARTAKGALALDLPTVVAAALGRVDVSLVGSADICTACGGSGFYSHRARGDEARHALAVWIDEPT